MISEYNHLFTKKNRIEHCLVEQQNNQQQPQQQHNTNGWTNDGATRVGRSPLAVETSQRAREKPN